MAGDDFLDWMARRAAEREQASKDPDSIAERDRRRRERFADLERKKAGISAVEEGGWGAIRGLTQATTGTARALGWLTDKATGGRAGRGLQQWADDADEDIAGTAGLRSGNEDIDRSGERRQLIGKVIGRLAGEVAQTAVGGTAASKGINALSKVKSTVTPLRAVASGASRVSRALNRLERGTALERAAGKQLPFLPVDVLSGAGSPAREDPETGEVGGFVLPGRAGSAAENVLMGFVPLVGAEKLIGNSREAAEQATRVGRARARSFPYRQAKTEFAEDLPEGALFARDIPETRPGRMIPARTGAQPTAGEFQQGPSLPIPGYREPITDPSRLLSQRSVPAGRPTPGEFQQGPGIPVRDRDALRSEEMSAFAATPDDVGTYRRMRDDGTALPGRDLGKPRPRAGESLTTFEQRVHDRRDRLALADERRGMASDRPGIRVGGRLRGDLSRVPDAELERELLGLSERHGTEQGMIDAFDDLPDTEAMRNLRSEGFAEDASGFVSGDVRREMGMARGQSNSRAKAIGRINAEQARRKASGAAPTEDTSFDFGANREGYTSPAMVSSIGGAGTGAVTGAALDDENPMRGAFLGGVAGAGLGAAGGRALETAALRPRTRFQRAISPAHGPIEPHIAAARRLRDGMSERDLDMFEGILGTTPMRVMDNERPSWMVKRSVPSRLQARTGAAGDIEGVGGARSPLGDNRTPVAAEPTVPPQMESVAPGVDDITRKRLGIPSDLANDINILAEEKRWNAALRTVGAEVETRTGVPGKVAEVKNLPGIGEQIVVDHGNGFKQSYSVDDLSPVANEAEASSTLPGGGVLTGAGAAEAPAGRAAARPRRTVAADEFGDVSTPGQRAIARAKAWEWAKAELKGKTITNKVTGIPLQFSTNGLEHSKRYSGDARKIASVRVLPAMIEDAEYRGWQLPYPNSRKKVRKMHYFRAEAIIGGERTPFEIVAHEAPNGTWYYDHMTEIKERPNLNSPVGSANKGGLAANETGRSVEGTLPEPGAKVKPEGPDRAGFIRNEAAQAVTGAGVGAATGGQVGATPEDRMRNAAIGAVVGGAGGYAGGRAVTGALEKGAERRAISEAMRIAVEKGAQKKVATRALATEARAAERIKEPTKPYMATIDKAAADRSALNPPTPEDLLGDLARIANDPSVETDLRTATERLVSEGKIPPKIKVSFDQEREIANALGLDAAQLATKDPSRKLSGTEMLALKDETLKTIARQRAARDLMNDVTRPQADRDFAAQAIGMERNPKTGLYEPSGKPGLLDRQFEQQVTRLSRDRSQTGRDLNMLKIAAATSEDPAEWLMRAQKMAGGRPLDDTVRAEILGAIGKKDFARAAKAVAELRKAPFSEKAEALYRAGLLSAFGRPLRDVMSNAVNVAGVRQAEQAVATLLDRAVGSFTGVRTVDWSANQSLKALWEGAKKGSKDAMAIAKGGGDPDALARAAERYDFLRETNIGVPVLDAYSKIVQRSLGVADAVAYRAAATEAATSYARALAKTEKLTGQAFDARVTDILKNPTPEMATRITEAATAAVWQNKTALGEGAASLRRGINKLTGGVGGTLTIPFAQTPGSMATQVLQSHPLAALATIPDIMKIAKRVDIPKAQARLVNKAARVSVGSGLIALGYMAAEHGGATAWYPSDQNERNQWKQDGRMENALKIGGTWTALSGALGPTGMLIGVGAALHTLMKEKGQSLGEALTLGSPASVGNVILDTPMLQGASTIYESVANPEEAPELLAKNYAGGVVPQFIQRAARAMDTNDEGNVVMRDTKGEGALETVGHTIKQGIPGMRESLPAKISSVGKERTTGPGGVVSIFNPFRMSDDEAAKDPVVAELQRLNVGLTERRQSGDEDRETLSGRAKEEGGQLRNILADVIQSDAYTAWPPPEWVQKAVQNDKVFADETDKRSDQEKTQAALLRYMTDRVRTAQTKKRKALVDLRPKTGTFR